MTHYTLPTLSEPDPVAENEAILIASGDLRLSANQVCWPAQEEAERRLIAAIEGEGRGIKRVHGYDATKQHGFIDSQKRGLER